MRPADSLLPDLASRAVWRFLSPGQSNKVDTYKGGPSAASTSPPCRGHTSSIHLDQPVLVWAWLPDHPHGKTEEVTTGKV